MLKRNPLSTDLFNLFGMGCSPDACIKTKTLKFFSKSALMHVPLKFFFR